jgi:hypothetical protein
MMCERASLEILTHSYVMFMRGERKEEEEEERKITCNC